MESYYCVCCMTTEDLGLLLDPGTCYAEILKDLFMVKVFPAEADVSDSYICGDCVARLLDTKQFKEQVLESIGVLRVKGLFKTRRGKGGYLLVKKIKQQIVIPESNEYYTEVLDESLLDFTESLSSPMNTIELPDNIDNDIINIENDLNQNNETNSHESVNNYNKQEAESTATSEITENTIEHSDNVEPALDNIKEVFNDTEFAEDFDNVLLDTEDVIENIEVEGDLANDLHDIKYVVDNIEIIENYNHILQDNEHSVEVDDFVKHPTYNLHIDKHGVGHRHQESLNVKTEVEHFAENSNYIYQEVEHVVEVEDHSLQDFKQRPGDFEEIEIHSRNANQDLDVLLDAPNNNITVEECLENEFDSSRPFQLVKVVDSNFRVIKQSKVHKQILSLKSSEHNEKTSKLFNDKQERLHNETVIVFNNAIKTEKDDNKVEHGTQLIENILTEVQDSPEKVKRITVSRSRKKKPKCTKPKEAVLYKVNADFRCEHCKETLPNLRVFHKHMNTHFPNYTCDICGKAFLSEKRLKRHKPSHEKGPFYCTVCASEFSNYNTMNSHRQRKHREVKLYKCTECDERFLTFHRRTIHLAEQHGRNERKYKCHLCVKEFMISGNLSAHVRRVHLNVKRHTCDRCGAGFFLKQELASHAALHTGLREFQCPVCRKRYPRKRTLDSHMRCHEERRYVCGECGRKFVQKVTLRCHMRVHERRLGGESLDELYRSPRQSYIANRSAAILLAAMALKALNPSGGRRLHRDAPQAVRFRTHDEETHLKSMESTESSLLGLVSGPQSYQAPDSGAPSPDLTPGTLQPASQRYRLNEHRIKLLTAINQIVQQRADLESNRTTLTNLHEELKRKLKRKVEECHLDKKEQLKALKQSNQKLEKDRFAIVHEMDHLKRHLEKEEAHHLQHARMAAAKAIQGHVTGKMTPSDHLFLPCSVANIPSAVCRNVAKAGPSRVADNKLQAARLMRDIAELRQRVSHIEARLSHELKRKKQVEVDILRLRKQLSITKSDVASLRLPLQPLRQPCARFA